MKTLSKKKFLGKPKGNRGYIGHWKNLRPLVPKAIANINYSPTPSQINMKPHIKAYLLQFLVPNTSCPSFNKNIRIKLRYDTDFEIMVQGILNNCYVTLRYGL